MIELQLHSSYETEQRHYGHISHTVYLSLMNSLILHMKSKHLSKKRTSKPAVNHNQKPHLNHYSMILTPSSQNPPPIYIRGEFITSTNMEDRTSMSHIRQTKNWACQSYIHITIACTIGRSYSKVSITYGAAANSIAYIIHNYK